MTFAADLKARNAHIVELRKQGLSIRVIAERMCLSNFTVHAIIAKKSAELAKPISEKV
jgi:DNA-binding NarL/FixJ family response regulator